MVQDLKMFHIEMLDIDDSGILTEVAIVKREENGTVFYINTETLHPIDKARLKKIVTSQHADKYPLWELLSQARLSNGMNALDYFHYNFVKVKRAPGVQIFNTGLSNASLNHPLADDKIIGSDMADPTEAISDGNDIHGITTSSRGL